MRNRMRWLLILALLLIVSATSAQNQSVVICDFDEQTVPWRSKFDGREVVDVGGDAGSALRYEFDLSQGPNYDWVRAQVEEGVDVRDFRYLSFRIRADANGERLTPMLMRRVERSPEHQHGEIVASAGRRYVELDFEGWRRISVPLEAFEGLDEIASEIHEFNFSLRARGIEAAEATLWIDDLALSVEPVGVVQPEHVSFPPADIAIEEEAEFFSLLDLEREGLEAVKGAVEAKDWQAAKQAWFEHLKTRQTPKWTWSRDEREEIMALEEELYGGMERHVRSAERVLAREFNFLGVPKTLERDVEWLHGPVEWTHVLSRHGYWKTLGYAWWATGDEKYAEDFAYMLGDWVEDNPVPRHLTNARGKHGTVWRTLEAGIRGDTWFDVMHLLMDSEAFDAEVAYLMTRSLVEHARHLHRYEVDFRHGNWQVVECVGLAAIGIMLPEFQEAAGWRDRAFRYLVEHMERDVYPDGAHHELTPGYHSWVMRKYVKAARLADLNGYEVPGLLTRHEKMFEFIMHLAKPDKRYPPLGDAGRGGSVIVQMGLGALLYDRPDMRWLGGESIHPSWIWLFGPQVHDRFAQLEGRRPEFTSSMLPHAQYLMMRSGWKPDDRYLLFDCAPWGGGHSHQDRLQVIAYAGRDLVIDPGIYSYDQPLSRTYFREAEAHNILLIDGDQPRANPEVLAWGSTETADFAVGRIAGGDVTHQRSVLFVRPDYWLVVDHVTGSGEHSLARQFRFPMVAVEADGQSVRTAFEDGANVRVTGLSGAELQMREGWLPTGSASAEPGPVAAFVAERELPATFATVIVPFDDEADLPELERLPSEDPAGVRMRATFPDGQTDELAVAPEQMRLAVGGETATARALLVRSGPRGDSMYVHGGAEAGG